MRGIQRSACNGIGMIAVALLLSLLLASSAWALSATDCATCHGADVVEGHHDTTDPNSAYLQGNCQLCHVGVTTGNDCSICHTFTLQDNTHHIAQNGAPIDCSQCHTGGADVQNCLTCHAGKVRTRHHQIASGGVTCAACHPGMPAQSDCTGCHGITRERHHTVAEATNVACTSCHAAMPQLPGCQGCHAPGAERTAHHDAAKASGTLCSACHAGTSQVGNCADCHQGANLPDHHTLPAYAANSCSACHTSAAVDEGGCRWCHYYNPDVNDKHHSDPTRLWVTYQLGCSNCHIFSGSSIPTGLRTDCISCHETKVATTGTQTRHHAKYPAATGNCAACHQAGTVTGSVCADCHGTPGIAIAPRADALTHHATPQAVAGSCNLCHSVTPVSEANCASCHTAQAPIADTHHMTLPAQLNQCASCHAGITAASLLCANCHISGAAIPIAQRHHESPTGQTGTCVTCHPQATPTTIPCSVCHNSERHHLQPQAVAGDCAHCHGNLQVNGSSCGICHTLPMAAFHHDAPLDNVGGNCAVCHSTVNDPSVCANCHTSTPHHATTWSQTGDCAHCHAIPAWAADRPAQAACSACHGTSMHGKGGPVQHYGACAACHSQQPFHPYNSSDSDRDSDWGDRDGRGGNGPGYDKFNMFVSQNSRRGDGDGREAPDRQLTFNKTTITHDGRSYTVPYFSMTYGNLALNRTASASRSESGYAASKAVDGDVASRWWAKSTSTQWLKVDLGAAKTVSKVALRWHSYYAKNYQIQVSTDNSTWTTVFSNSYGAGGMETRTFTARSARYIRIYCQTASSSNGYSIYELEAYAQ